MAGLQGSDPNLVAGYYNIPSQVVPQVVLLYKNDLNYYLFLENNLFLFYLFFYNVVRNFFVVPGPIRGWPGAGTGDRLTPPGGRGPGLYQGGSNIDCIYYL